MKLPTSNKTTSFGKKPYVKKGYYPAKLLKVDPYADKEGTLVEGKYGHQLIFEFAIYEKDANDTPVKPLMFEEEGKDPVSVRIPKFVYHEYKDKDNPGEFQTAITPNSAITATLQSLGWVFSENDVDIEPLIGNWAEVNINDFETKTKDGEKYTASTIQDVGVYSGGEIPKGIEEVPASKKPESVNKQVTEGAPAKPAESNSSPKEKTPETVESLEVRVKDMDKMLADGYVSAEGHAQAVEQLKAKIDSLKK